MSEKIIQLFPNAQKKDPVSTNSEKLEGKIQVEERNAIILLTPERFNFMLAVKRSNPFSINSDTCRNAVENLKGTSKVEIAEMINLATELEIKRKPTYFTTAFNMLLE
ncbi:MAG: hypothetical protein Q7T51_03260 [Candidatus Moranbacteria bacterium]|nr:hypothetical protein [Candidatus Moranbacteria bacterium]